MNNNKQNFDNLCRHIWQDNPHDFIAVRVNSIFAEGQAYFFAAPDNNKLTGVIAISEAGIITLAKRLGYENVRIVKQRDNTGRFVVPNPEQIKRDELLDY